MYEQGTDSVIPSANWKETESATVELCSRRPSGLTSNQKKKIQSYNHRLQPYTLIWLYSNNTGIPQLDLW